MGEDREWRVLRYEDGVPIYACAYHPQRETTLRCNRCGRPICTECAVLTDVGYRCPDCVNELESRFYRAAPRHVLTSLAAAAGLGFLTGLAGVFIGRFLGLWTVLVAFPWAGLVAEGIWRAGARHRARHLNVYTAVLVFLAGLTGVAVGTWWGLGSPLTGLLLVGIAAATVWRVRY
ncbi:MAG: hypothetical protein GXO55_00270 [Chloroflexi bacterium]|nr:hypothetical protein [Chloroflexota bacterium]